MGEETKDQGHGKHAITGHVFGQYDSRGGTTFIPEEDRDAAARKFAALWEPEPKDMEEMVKGVIEDNWIGKARLWVKETPEDGTELDGYVPDEWEGEGTWPVQVVIAPDRLVSRPEEEFIDGEAWGEETIDLEVVEAGEKAVVVVDGKHPRWDDDAYNFVYGTGL